MNGQPTETRRDFIKTAAVASGAALAATATPQPASGADAPEDTKKPVKHILLFMHPPA